MLEYIGDLFVDSKFTKTPSVGKITLDKLQIDGVDLVEKHYLPL